MLQLWLIQAVVGGNVVDGQQFDDLAKRLATPASRRASLRPITSGFLGGTLALVSLTGVEAGKRSKKKKKSKRKKKKGSQGNANVQPQLCGGAACSTGQVCCPDQRCGAKCCANGRACNVVCSGPNGNDYCCDASRPVAICGGCWQAGSTPCSTPGHCCGPNQVCCGDDHCCDIDTQECRVNCGGVVGSNSCCKKGSVLCCPDGVPG